MGHKASDWTDQVAVVRVQVVTRGTEAAVRLFRTDSGKVFANSPVRIGGPPAVEQVTDSSRYFALRIEDGKGELNILYFGIFVHHPSFIIFLYYCEFSFFLFDN